jgi:glycosyltransferase involved in cell wall biosynthesis
MLRPLNTLPPATAREVRVFAKVRDEALRLPYFLRYYRQLGAARFVIVDNASTDGTPALLRAQPDVHLFHADGSFGAAGGGQAWLDALLDAYGEGHWCLTVDADELLVYPGCEQADLPALCRALEREGAAALACMLIDMYGGAVHAPDYAPGEPFLAACPWFDPGPYWRAGPSADCPAYEIYGGVRQRVFYPHWQAPGTALRLSERLYDFGNRFAAVRGNATIQSWRARRPPNLAKVPLVLWRSGLRYLACTHRISPVRLAAASGGLLHFKFLTDFRAKAAHEAARGEYFDGAREYRRYAEVLSDDPHLTLWHPGAARYRDSAQLCALGLMTAAGEAAARRETVDA